MIVDNKYLYRFRPPFIFADEQKKCISEEIDNQELFFGAVSENNDPMDGFINIYWEGDEVLWLNFVKHYCLRLLDSSIYRDVIGDSVEYKYEDSGVFRMPWDLDTPEYRIMYENLIKDVLGDVVVQELLTILKTTKKFFLNELSTILSLFHNVLAEKVFEAKDKHFGSKTAVFFNRNHELRKRLTGIAKIWSQVDHKKFATVGEAISRVSSQIVMIVQYNNTQTKGESEINKDNFSKWLALFPHDYLTWEASNILPPYYTASLSHDCRNSSMWGHYAKGHQGVCLMFQFLNNSVELDGGGSMLLQDVEYDIPVNINYFERMGSFSGRAIHEFWLSNGQQRSSYCNLYCDGDTFRKQYWDDYQKKIAYKFSEWKYEREIRAVLPTMDRSIMPSKDRLKKYKLVQLKGIIFGLRIDPGLRDKIFKIMNKKLSGDQRTEFSFYEAYYSYFEKKLKFSKIPLKLM